MIELSEASARDQASWPQLVWRRFRSHPAAFAGSAVLLLVILLTTLAFLSPYDPKRHVIFEKFQAPSLRHPFGTDSMGRDALTRLLYGGRMSLLVGFAATCISLGIGIPVGMIAGYYGSTLDGILMRVTDTFLSFPPLFVLILVSALLRETSIPALAEGQPLVIAFAIGVLSWMTVSRLVRASVLALRARDFVVAARSLGASNYRIMTLHILPNAVGPVIVEATLLVAAAILTEAGLGFIGFGIHPRTPTWGNMLRDGQLYLAEYPWLAIFPGLLILLTVISINYLGDGLRDALDPRTAVRSK